MVVDIRRTAVSLITPPPPALQTRPGHAFSYQLADAKKAVRGTSDTIDTASYGVSSVQNSQEIPDDFAVVRGGEKPLPLPGTPFSGAAGTDKHDAAKGIPHNKMRATTAAAIRAYGGQVTRVPELSKGGVLNVRHVEVV